jgi:5'-nucleotidase
VITVTARLKFLVTNDDGVHAPGLAAMQQALTELGEVLVLAPHEHLSGCSHQSTTHRGLELTELAPGKYQLDGTPVDCTRAGLLHLAPEVDWVCSGINAGGNLGADVYPSGTVAAVREAAYLGKRGIAVSQYIRRRLPIQWEPAIAWTAEVIRRLLPLRLEPGEFWNVNLPDFDRPIEPHPEIVFCALDGNPLPVRFVEEDGKLHYRGVYQERARTAGCDVEICFSGQIAITKLRVV